MLRRWLPCLAFLIPLVGHLEVQGQTVILRGAIVSGGGSVSGGNASVRASLGEPFVLRSEGGSVSVQPGLWLPVPPVVSGVDEGLPDLPFINVLHQNLPNPFNPSTVIKYSLARDDPHVRLAVYSISGRLVRMLVNGPRKAGAHVQNWDGTDWGHRAVASGTYIYLIETSEFRAYRKLTLLR